MKFTKKLMSLVLAFLTVVGLVGPMMVTEADAAEYSLSFSDVPAKAWYYDEVMEMANKGIINGTTTPVNGVGTFLPYGHMTTEQFYTILARTFFTEEYNNFDYSTLTAADLADTSDGYKRTKWGVAAQKVLNAHGIGHSIYDITVECIVKASNRKIDRNSAAMLMVQCFEYINEDAANLRLSYKGDSGADSLCRLMEESYKEKFGTTFRSDIGEDLTQHLYTYRAVQGEAAFCWPYYAYALGLMNGSSGGFNEKTQTWTPVDMNGSGTLTRAEGATMVYRMMHPELLTEHPELAMMGIEVEGRTANTDYARYDSSWDDAYKIMYGINLWRDLEGHPLLTWDPSIRGNSTYKKVYDCSYGDYEAVGFSLRRLKNFWGDTSYIYFTRTNCTRFYCVYDLKDGRTDVYDHVEYYWSK